MYVDAKISYQVNYFSCLGELLLRTSELDQLLYLTVMDFGQELGAAESPVGNEPPTTSTRPFSWYNYLQKERSSEYRTLIEFVQKLQSGTHTHMHLIKKNMYFSKCILFLLSAPLISNQLPL